MEGFSLLNYWSTSGGGGGNVITADTTIVHPRAATKTIFTSTPAVSPDSSDDEDGPYFDLEFALPEDESDAEEESSEETMEIYKRSPKIANRNEIGSGNCGEELSESENEDEEEEEEEEEAGEVNITLTSDQNHGLTLFPSEELLFKGNLVSVEPTSIILNDSEENSRFPVFLLKSATKFRVLFLKLKKSKSVNGILEKAETMEKIEPNGRENSSPQEVQVKQSTLSGKFLAVMCKAEEVRMPLVSLFTRDNSSKNKHGGKCTKNNQEDFDSTAASEERNLTKEVVQKYIKMVKPLYVRVSKRYAEKLKFSGQLNFSAGASKRGGAVPLTAEKGGETTKAASSTGSVNTHPKQASINFNNLQAGLKVVRKHLGKSRSASAIVTPPPPLPPMASSRRDDSLLQIHDGIQGAILHCKKSFNATRDVELLSRSVSDPSYEKSVKMSTDSSSSTSSSSSSVEETKDNLELS